MLCPQCGLSETRVIETRTSDGGKVVRRRRECPSCSHRFTTYERVEERQVLWVVKKDGRRESFDRCKLLRGLMRACEKLPVPLDVLEDAACRIEGKLRERESGEVLSMEVGDLAMDELRRINKVAYVRFASVYREFTDLSNFAAEIARLIEEREDKHDNH
ncbi:transcriptional regulator NrdR [Thermanaerovibrio velox DSM 12556]|jgi:transcriptional repressor NrdR|uniref:Transcriptional repressor NrdR n=1 Tax=Thermanaerovibrio velox DSM 12556 TaxID=926567 RepID=H0USK1_9BACT|nr:transcriptional regulator NrdR [Thermanaerovibrio velox]EHM10290.1 transcriptional regulator NrdR [Thermanaerovibrio velox DSM 12556]